MRLALALFLILGGWANAGEIPGLVKEKPASGLFVEVDGQFMVPYTATIPGTAVTFEMIPVPGGEFLMGSPDSEAGHQATEGPQVRVKTRPFWMQKNEIRWAEYKEYMGLYNIFKRFEASNVRPVSDDKMIDAITAPTELYEPTFTFEFGEDPELPAVSMTLYAARQYTKWISIVTGQQYRVPTEAEWEYAARAGSQTAYSYGNDPAKLGEVAWFAGNSDSKGPRKVGQGKPNAFGLCDMHGNVAEWVQDELSEDGYAKLKEKAAAGPLSVFDVMGKPAVHYPRVLKGGSWQNSAEECRCAARLGSNYALWKDTDPNLPKSPWWMTDEPCRGIGFRILRSVDEMPREEIETFWNVDSDDLKLDVDGRILGGRGGYGIVDKELPEAIKKLKAGGN
jgi:sulfatase modifying factor 1